MPVLLLAKRKEQDVRWNTPILLCVGSIFAVSAIARADESLVLYKDWNWGIVRQNSGNTCIVVLNTDDRRHALHFLIDGENKTAQVGILRDFLPANHLSIARLVISIGRESKKFVRQFEFRADANGVSDEVARNDLRNLLLALEKTSGVNVSFPGGESWEIRAPKTDEAAIAMDQCWKKAANAIT